MYVAAMAYVVSLFKLFLKSYLPQNLVGSSRLGLHVAPCGVGCGLQVLAVGIEALHQLAEVFVAADFHSSPYGEELLGFLETLVVGAEYHGHVPYGGFEHIVDAHSESTAHVGHLGA